jgi:hypothetical protein
LSVVLVDDVWGNCIHCVNHRLDPVHSHSANAIGHSQQSTACAKLSAKKKCRQYSHISTCCDLAVI